MKICITYGELKAAGKKVNAKGIREIMEDQMPEFDMNMLDEFAPYEYDDVNMRVFVLLPPI